MRTTTLLVGILLGSGTTQGQGTITGCVTDKHGGVLPGVAVVASTGEIESKAVTDSTGCYQLTRLVAGTYTVTATLAGFMTGRADGVLVVSGRSTSQVDFELCLSALEQISWVPPRDLSEAWRQADLVAHVRVISTAPVRSECPSRDFEHTVTIRETFKYDRTRALKDTLTFVQQNWARERTPYAIGQELVVFLSATPTGFMRTAGPYWVFLLHGDVVVSFGSQVNTDWKTATALLSKLRAMRKEGEMQKSSCLSGVFQGVAFCCRQLAPEPNLALHPTGPRVKVQAGG